MDNLSTNVWESISCGIQTGSWEQSFNWEAPAFGTYTFAAVSALGVPIKLVVLTRELGCMDAPNEIICSSDGFSPIAQETVELEAGQQVVIVVEGEHGTTLDFGLQIAPGSGSGDLCDTAQDLGNTSSVEANGSTADGGTDFVALSCGIWLNNIEHTYIWTPSKTRTYRFRALTSPQ